MIDDVSGANVGRSTVCYGDSTPPAGGELIDQFIARFVRVYDPSCMTSPAWVLDRYGHWSALEMRCIPDGFSVRRAPASHTVDLLVRAVGRGTYTVPEWVCLGVDDKTDGVAAVRPLPQAPDRAGLDAAVCLLIADMYGDTPDLSPADLLVPA